MAHIPGVQLQPAQPPHLIGRIVTTLWFRGLARLGYITKGVVYLLMGWLAALMAVGLRRATTDTQVALQTIERQPAGSLLIMIIAIGLAGYALWNVIRGIGNFEGKTIVGRLGRFGRGASHALLAWAAFKLATNGPAGGVPLDETARAWGAYLLGLSFGFWLVLAGGLLVIGAGIGQFYLAWTAKFQHDLDLSSLRAQLQAWIVQMGRLGLAARGVVLSIIGGFVVLAAFQHAAWKIKGIDGALREVAERHYGDVALGIVAAGLICHGVYSLIEACFHRLNQHEALYGSYPEPKA